MTAIVRETFPVGPLGANCTVLGCAQTREALIFDPGDDAAEILAVVARLALRPVAIVLTHGHIDHVLAAGSVAQATGATIALHPDDRFLYDGVAMQAEMLGFEAPPALPRPGRELRDGDRVRAGNLELQILHTPGHSPGSICALLQLDGEPPLLVAGDTLFYRSVGRTDLWGGSHAQLESSIRDRLYQLPPDTEVLTGHGPGTTIGGERSHNFFMRG